MDFSFTEETSALKQMCADFAAREIAPYAADWSARGAIPSEVFTKLGSLGLMGMLVDEEHGGAGASMVEYVAVMEELGGADQSFAAAWNAHSTIATLPLLRFGTAEQKERWLRPLAEGRRIGAFALTEPSAGSDAAGIRTTATRVSGGWVINGSKTFISNAGTEISMGVCALAVTGEGDSGSRHFGVFFIPDGAEGYSKGQPLKKIGWKALDTRELFFENCFVPDDHLIGSEGDGLRQFLAVLDPGRISVAALSLSLAGAALKMAVDYAGQRTQFGQKLSDFQAVGHHLANIATETEAARWLVYRAAWLCDTGQPFSKAAAMAKLYASEAANRAASLSLQVHGGYGFMAESAISRFYSDAKILEIGEGTNEIQRNIIARLLVGS